MPLIEITTIISLKLDQPRDIDKMSLKPVKWFLILV